MGTDGALVTATAKRPTDAKQMLASMLASRGKWGRRMVEAWLGAEVATQAYRALREKLDRPSFTVAVDGSDPLFDDLHVWLVRQIPAEDQKSILVSLDEGRGRQDEPVDLSSSSRPNAHGLRVTYDGERDQVTIIDGHEVTVQVRSVPIGGASSVLIGAEHRGRMKEMFRMVFTCQTLDARDAVMRFLDSLAEAYRQESRPPVFRLAGRWGGWDTRTDLPARSLSSVVLNDGQMDEIVSDLRHFLSRESVFARAGVPWHRGYLLYGPPGTGKTSLARALATEFHLNVFYVSLGDLTEDSSLLTLISSVQPRSVLLLEDIDVAVNAALDRESQKDDDGPPQISMSGLLNALDGIATPHGLVTIMTTNRRDVLDEALIRPGRIDREFPIEYLRGGAAARLVKVVSGVDVPHSWFIDPVSPAKIVSAVLPHVGDDDEVLASVRSLSEVTCK